jgi:hypothetical protein
MNGVYYCYRCDHTEEDLECLTLAECCGVWLCDTCIQKHDEKFGGHFKPEHLF